MPFGLRNAPAMFLCLMNRVVPGLEGCSVYLDDLVIYSDTWHSYPQHICLSCLNHQSRKASVFYGNGDISGWCGGARLCGSNPQATTRKQEQGMIEVSVKMFPLFHFFFAESWLKFSLVI